MLTLWEQVFLYGQQLEFSRLWVCYCRDNVEDVVLLYVVTGSHVCIYFILHEYIPQLIHQLVRSVEL